VHTVSRKSERLVNLTIALLATKRFLTKSEIFRTIEGYEGSNESMERMFERDKDELRALGVQIEVGSFDPLFGDEPGYRIKPEDYRLTLSGLSPTDISTLSLAAQAWQGAALAQSAQAALLKLQGLNIESDLDSLPLLAPKIISSPDFLPDLLLALSDRSTITFTYRDSTLQENARTVNLYSIHSRNGFWYATGHDKEKDDIRNFRTDRIVGALHVSDEKNSYEIPPDFSASAIVENFGAITNALVKIRTGKGQTLRSSGKMVGGDDDWAIYEIPLLDEESFSETILWHLDDVEVIEPKSLRERVLSSLQVIAKNHG
jgi:proteasome accessory factor B